MKDRVVIGDEHSFNTLCVHGGNKPDPHSGAVRTPLVMANSYLLPEDTSETSWSDIDNPAYTRDSGYNQICLEEKLAQMEGTDRGVVFATGVAALHALFFTFLRSGDHVVVGNVSYEAVHTLFSKLLPERYSIEASFVDASDPEAVRAAIRPNTKLIHVETIANPTTLVADIAGIADVAKDAGILFSVDSTFTPPPFFRPCSLGADVVIHSLTKYINGHGDAMGGVVLSTDSIVRKLKEAALVDVGGVISPFNAWMIMRGSVTLPLRLPHMYASTEKIADFLDSDDRIAFVRYPGLESHPQHELAKEQFEGQGYGAVLAFAVDGDSRKQDEFVANLNIVTSTVSLGHDETLIVHVRSDGRGGSEHYPEPFQRFGHLRLSVGLESPKDLITDIKRALDTTFV